jgi:hypothetical protein
MLYVAAPLAPQLNCLDKADCSLSQSTLMYGCLCGNNQQPNLTEYTLTMPFFTCQEWGNQCATKCGSDNACVSSCRQDHPCGALDPPKNNTANTTSTSASGTATATATATTTSNQVFGGFGSSATASTVAQGGSNLASSSMELGAAYSMTIVFGAMFAGFALL